MRYTYIIDHEVITRGTTTIESETELSVEQLKAQMGTTGSQLPGDWEEDPLATEYGYPMMYGDVLGITGDLDYDNQN